MKVPTMNDCLRSAGVIGGVGLGVYGGYKISKEDSKVQNYALVAIGALSIACAAMRGVQMYKGHQQKPVEEKSPS